MVRDPNDPGTRPMRGFGLSAKDRQAAFKERQREAGLVQRTWWVTPEEEAAIQALLDSPRMTAQRRLNRNTGIVNEHKKEIRRRKAAGEKPAAIAKWLADEYGFEGTGATLNGLMP